MQYNSAVWTKAFIKKSQYLQEWITLDVRVHWIKVTDPREPLSKKGWEALSLNQQKSHWCHNLFLSWFLGEPIVYVFSTIGNQITQRKPTRKQGEPANSTIKQQDQSQHFQFWGKSTNHCSIVQPKTLEEASDEFYKTFIVPFGHFRLFLLESLLCTDVLRFGFLWMLSVLYFICTGLGNVSLTSAQSLQSLWMLNAENYFVFFNLLCILDLFDWTKNFSQGEMVFICALHSKTVKVTKVGILVFKAYCFTWPRVHLQMTFTQGCTEHTSTYLSKY